tara:strand:- start:303 stop:764 length:462 start_codon:yes stop_codon:yes gene_type:complete
MPIISKEDFKINVKFDKPILSLDYGEKRIGIAISSPECSIAFPKEVLQRIRIREDMEYIKNYILENKIQAVIIGMPYNMDGTEGKNCQTIRMFANHLLKSINVNIIFWDERLSTVAQEKILISNDISRKKRKKVIDKLSASYFLQSFLDFLKN